MVPNSSRKFRRRDLASFLSWKALSVCNAVGTSESGRLEREVDDGKSCSTPCSGRVGRWSSSLFALVKLHSS